MVRRDAFRDGSSRAAAHPDLRPEAASPSGTAESDAWAGALPDAPQGAPSEHPAAGAEKSAARARDAPEQAAAESWLTPAEDGLGGGAMYTGRGPVCGTIMRGKGGCIGDGAPGLAAIGACGRGDTTDDGTAGGAAWTGGAETGWGAAGGGVIAAAGGGPAPPLRDGLAAAEPRAWAGAPSGVWERPEGAPSRPAEPPPAWFQPEGAQPRVEPEERGGARGAAGACCLRSRFNTSPGFEI